MSARAAHRLLRSIAAAALTGLLAGVFVLGGQAPASAHASLVSSTPEDGQRLATLPDELTFTFSEDIDSPAYAVLNSPDGDQVAAEEVEVDGPTVRVAVVDDPGAGTYTAAFRVVSADGHPVTGQLSFVVGDGAPESPAAGSEESAAPSAGAGADGSADAAESGAESDVESRGASASEDDALLEPWQWAVGLGLLALAAVLWLLSRRARP